MMGILWPFLHIVLTCEQNFWFLSSIKYTQLNINEAFNWAGRSGKWLFNDETGLASHSIGLYFISQILFMSCSCLRWRSGFVCLRELSALRVVGEWSRKCGQGCRCDFVYLIFITRILAIRTYNKQSITNLSNNDS